MPLQRGMVWSFVLWLLGSTAFATVETLPLDGLKLQPLNSEVNWFYSEKPVKIASIEYQGFGFVATAEGDRTDGVVNFNVTGWERFTATVGLNDQWRNQDGQVTLELDGKPVLKWQCHTGIARQVDIPINGAKTLGIRMLVSILLAEPKLQKGTPTSIAPSVAVPVPSPVAHPVEPPVISPQPPAAAQPLKMKLEGEAQFLGDAIRLTGAKRFCGGAAWSATTVPVQNGFTFEFDYQLSNRMYGGGDNIVFVVQNQSDHGLINPQNHNRLLLRHCIAVAICTWNGTSDGIHISIKATQDKPIGNWNNQAQAIACAPHLTQLVGDKLHHVKIVYSPGVLAVYLDQQTTPILQADVQLSQIMSLDQGKAWVGIAASTGGKCENHDVSNWTFISK